MIGKNLKYVRVKIIIKKEVFVNQRHLAYLDTGYRELPSEENRRIKKASHQGGSDSIVV